MIKTKKNKSKHNKSKHNKKTLKYIYYRHFNINIYNLSENEKPNNFKNIKPFISSSHGRYDTRFRQAQLNNENYIIKQLRNVNNYITPSKKLQIDYNFIIKKFKTIKQNYKLFISINEIMASLIYNRVFKLYVPEIILIYDNDQNEYMIGSKKDNNLSNNNITKKPFHNDIVKGFLVDCIMANWDINASGNAFITTKNNNNNSESKNRINRIDVGGTMFFRAMGDLKIPFINNTPPIEHNTLINPPDYIKPTFYKNIINLLDKSAKYIKNIYEIDKFSKLDDIRYELLSKMRDIFMKGKNKNIISNIMSDIYILINTNIIQIKRRWIWYLIHKNFCNYNNYIIPIPNNIIRDEKITKWKINKVYPYSYNKIPIKQNNSIRIMTCNMGNNDISKKIKKLINTGVDIECYQDIPIKIKENHKVYYEPIHKLSHIINTINYNDVNLNTYCTIIIKDSFLLEKSNTQTNKFIINDIYINVLGLEFKKNKKKIIIFNVNLYKNQKNDISIQSNILKLIINKYEKYQSEFSNCIILGNLNSYNNTEYSITQIEDIKVINNTDNKDNISYNIYNNNISLILKQAGFVEAFEIMGLQSPTNTSYLSGKVDFIWLSPLWDKDLKINGLYCDYNTTYTGHLPLIIDILIN